MIIIPHALNKNHSDHVFFLKLFSCIYCRPFTHRCVPLGHRLNLRTLLESNFNALSSSLRSYMFFLDGYFTTPIKLGSKLLKLGSISSHKLGYYNQYNHICTSNKQGFSQLLQWFLNGFFRLQREVCLLLERPLWKGWASHLEGQATTRDKRLIKST